MPVSDLAIYSGARAVGFLSNALFVGPSPKLGIIQSRL